MLSDLDNTARRDGRPATAPTSGTVEALTTRLNATFSKEPVAVPKGSQVEQCSWLEELFNFLCAAGPSAKLECAVPDTVVFKYHRPMTWFYWDRSVSASGTYLRDEGAAPPHRRG